MNSRKVYFVSVLLFVMWSAVYGVSSAYGHSIGYDRNTLHQEAPPVTPQPPQPDGSIIHVVRPGDTLFGIALVYGVSVDELRRLNNIPPEVGNIYYGQRLIVKLAPTPSLPPNATIIIVTASNGTPAATETPGAPTEMASSTAAETISSTVAATEAAGTATLTEAPISSPTETPTPTTEKDVPTATLIPLNNKAGVCVTVFNDANKNHWHDAAESLLADVELDFVQGSTPAQQIKTSSDEATCVTDLQSGILTVNAVPPTNYGLTTSGNLEVDVKSGEKIALAIGAAEGYVVPTEDANLIVDATPTPATKQGNIVDTLFNNSGFIVLGLAGLVLVGGLGVVLLARRG